MRILKIFFAVFFAVFFGACSSDDGDKKSEQISNFKEFKDGEEIVLKGVLGKDMTLIRKNGGFVVKGEEDKFLMLDIFGTFCPPCQKEAPEIMQYQLDNRDKFNIIGLTHFENVTDEYVLNEFIKKYNAFYFITNDTAKNSKIAEQIVRDIAYKHEIALPFKVLLKDGYYQILTDNDTGKFGVKYYIGGIKMDRFKKDIERIENLK